VSSWKSGRRSLAAVAAALVAECLACPAAQAITYVPAVPCRALWRGHNPAERLARELGAVWRLPVLELLARAAEPRPQRGLSSADRRRNVAGAFLSAAGVPEAIALIDDVYTTGATVNEAARVLRRGGGRRVEVITFARALRS
jgi:predicted amidophosphoribosyltransferase